jgi:hypothetical protein
VESVIFCICCSTGECLLHFLKVIVIAILRLAPITDCQTFPSRGARRNADWKSCQRFYVKQEMVHTVSVCFVGLSYLRQQTAQRHTPEDSNLQCHMQLVHWLFLSPNCYIHFLFVCIQYATCSACLFGYFLIKLLFHFNGLVVCHNKPIGLPTVVHSDTEGMFLCIYFQFGLHRQQPSHIKLQSKCGEI